MACGGNPDKGTETSSAGSAKPAAEEGCGKDYGDPQKQFCVTLPAGYQADPQIESSELYPELVRFTGPDTGDGISVSVGFTSSNFKTYDDQLNADEGLMKIDGRAVEASGPTKGDQGKWWIFTDSGVRTITATAKAANGKAVNCSPANTTPTPAAVEACKSIRPFTGKS
ncbi:hypothetical protein GCM10029964_083960 [Kibdelosporangium lantanae]